MKKTYETPSVEVVKFQYRDQVVVASGCLPEYKRFDNDGDKVCDTEGEYVSSNK